MDDVYGALSCAATPCTSILRLRHSTREGARNEEGRRWRTTATLKRSDGVYASALSCAATPCTSILRLRHGTREGTGDEEGRRWRTTATSRALMKYMVHYRAPPINCALIFVAKSDNNRVA